MKDLFGREVEDADSVTSYLREIDTETIEARAANLHFVIRIAPECGFAMPHETYLTFTEARDAFVSGLYVATIMLAQAFIEHRLQMLLKEKGEYKTSEKGLSQILIKLRELMPQHAYIFDRIDGIRKSRNPFSHLKDFDHQYTITQASLRERTDPSHVLHANAKEAISLMYTVAVFRF